MFKKTRLRIFALIVMIATVIITLMLAVIYIANRKYGYERDFSLLDSYVEDSIHGPRSDMGAKPDRTDMGPEPDRQDMGPEPDRTDMGPRMRGVHNKMFRLSTFYSVFYRDGEVVTVNCNGGILYSEQEIIEIANSILLTQKEHGVHGKMPFMVKSTDDFVIVALIDNTMEVDNSYRLFNNSLIVGFATWCVIVLLAWFFSEKIVNPLEENDVKQKQFISDAGHELKTPISVISANADLLSREIGDNKWLSNILYENERMGHLVKQLLELVRAENVLQEKERLDFSRLVSGGALPFEGVAFENGLTLNTEIEENIFVDGNQSRLSQLVSILIDNAIEHGGEGKDINVKLCTQKNSAVLSVVNSGKAIPTEVREQLFERFYRADEARTDDCGHYGLGLAIAKAVVMSHGGKITVECYDGLVEFKVSIPKA